jgi:hypothetical protein
MMIPRCINTCGVVNMNSAKGHNSNSVFDLYRVAYINRSINWDIICIFVYAKQRWSQSFSIGTGRDQRTSSGIPA